MSSYYMVASKSFSAKVFEIKSEADYIEAIKWIKSFVGSVILTTGVEFLSTALNNNMIDNDINDVILQKLNFSTLKYDSMSLKGYLIKILEKQLDILKK